MLQKDFKQLHLGFGVTKENGQELNGAMLCLDREEREQDQFQQLESVPHGQWIIPSNLSCVAVEKHSAHPLDWGLPRYHITHSSSKGKGAHSLSLKQRKINPRKMISMVQMVWALYLFLRKGCKPTSYPGFHGQVVAKRPHTQDCLSQHFVHK